MNAAFKIFLNLSCFLSITIHAQKKDSIDIVNIYFYKKSEFPDSETKEKKYLDSINFTKSDTLFLFHNDSRIERYMPKKIEPIFFRTKNNIKRQIGVREEYYFCYHCQGFPVKKRDSLFYQKHGLGYQFHKKDTGAYFYKIVNLMDYNYGFYFIHFSISSDYFSEYKYYISSQTNKEKKAGMINAKKNYKLTTEKYYGNIEEIRSHYAFYDIKIEEKGHATYFSPTILIEYLRKNDIVIYLQENDESVEEGMALFKEVYFDWY